MISGVRHWCDRCGRKQVRRINTYNPEETPMEVRGIVCFACGYWKEEGQYVPPGYLAWIQKEVGMER